MFHGSPPRQPRSQPEQVRRTQATRPDLWPTFLQPADLPPLPQRWEDLEDELDGLLESAMDDVLLPA
jgi:hypothetical protein